MEAKINLRIDEQVKIELEELALNDDLSLSEYLRELLKCHVSGYHYESDDYDENIEVDLQPEKYGVSSRLIIRNLDVDTIDASESLKNYRYEQNFEFTCLFAWLFAKHLNPLGHFNKPFLKDVKLKVEKVIESSSFSQELKMEFVKVLNDLNRYIAEPDYNGKKFYFSDYSSAVRFNYYMLLNEVLSLKK